MGKQSNLLIQTRSEYASVLSGSFERGERLINLRRRVFRGHRDTNTAGVGRNGGGANGGSEDIVGEQVFGKPEGGICSPDHNRHDRGDTGGHGEAQSPQAFKQTLTIV